MTRYVQLYEQEIEARAVLYKLTTIQHLLLRVLVGRAGCGEQSYRTAEITATYDNLARACGCSRRAIIDALRRLEDLGLVLVDSTPGTGTRITIVAYPVLVAAWKESGDVHQHIASRLTARNGRASA